MTLDDDSFLSAYLDGQLGPEDQQAVDAALLEDARLADELRGLAVVRDLLAGLPRESPVDLTSRVMRRIRRRAMLGPARGIIALGPVRAAGLAALAAGVLMMLAASWFLPGRRGPGRGDGRDLALAGPPAQPVRPALSVDRWPSFAPHAVPRRAALADGSEERPPSATEPAEEPGDRRDELVHVRKYLDHPQLRRIFLVTDLGDGAAEKQVASLVEQTTHFNFYKITISQGIVLDPRHPDQATVFALVVGPRELDSLRDRLRAALKDRVEEEAADPGVVTRLADLGRVEACPPSPTAHMEIPGDVLEAYKAGAVVGRAEAPRAEQPERVEGPTPEQENSAPIPDRERTRVARNGAGPAGRSSSPVGQRTGDNPARAEAADQSLVVLVWVSRHRPG